METKPKPTKKKPVDLNKEVEIPTFFTIPEEIKAAAKAQGLEVKWLNSIHLQRNNGYHRSGWAAFKFEGGKPAGSFGMGVNAEGFVVRGDMIIGARKLEVGDQFRERIAKRNHKLNQFTKSAADELRQQVKGAGRVLEGYENDGDEE